MATDPTKLESFDSGTFREQYEYKSFSPNPINHTWTWDDAKVNTMLETATRKLGELNAFSLIVPDVDTFIRMHVVKEANTSSRIEGTQTNMDEALLKEEDVAPQKRDDWQEVQNYVEAMNTAIEELEELPLSTRLLRNTHATLMQGVRGEHKLPGQFRDSQNWIGGSSLNDAIYIPPHQNEVPDLMSDLEKFLYNDSVPHLIRIAIAHYQFETIHPFLDGNGRIGRLMITLYFVSTGLLNKPTLYLSDFFERNKAAYYDALMYVRTNNNMLHWVKFFLNAVIETAEKGKQTFNQILELRNDINGKLLSLGQRAENGNKLINYLFQQPFVNVNEVSEYLDVSTPTANRLINDFEELGLLKETTGYERNRIFFFDRYYNIFRE
ncbi:Fic family protein [Aliifodinibius sp. S!AR15-10]|uniref:Fic family protein n=1 Tax=Aliifodinibius sp. S!AR15-10 TaxID=2950437 RepID=UPI002865CDA4|nr:Fic family protein [Aliifodinibius sp. S!AR15-10]MDR8394456.1 Fic family protein [Aliifodinibius sp. S!AR15-10]